MTDDALRGDATTLLRVVSTTLGPFGANKLVVEENGTVTTTASGAETLARCDLADPTVGLLRTAAEGFRDRHRDGTTTLVTLVGALLDEAADLRELGLHPTAIERGFRSGLALAADYVDAHDYPVDAVGTEAVARTALTATRDPRLRDAVAAELADVVDAIREDAGATLDPRDVAVVGRVGGAPGETELVRGVVLEEAPVLESMPRSVDGGIALVSAGIDVDRPGSETGRRPGLTLRLSPDSFEDRAAFADHEDERFQARVEDARAAGCRAVVTSESVNDRVKRTLAAHGLTAIQRVDEADMRRLARATGAPVLGSFDQVSADALGDGGMRVRRYAGKDMTVVETPNEPVYTVFCRGPDPRTLAAFSAAVESAIAAVAAATRTGRVVPGGGAVEAGAAGTVRRGARGVGGREALAAEAVGEALTAVPRTLAGTAGLDPVDALAELRSAHDAGDDTAGVDVVRRTVGDVFGDDAVAEPAATKLAVWEAAVDLASRLVRIDERLPATDLGDGADGSVGDAPASGD